jgi:cytochrome bd-type quinol oxidase subunit 2
MIEISEEEKQDLYTLFAVYLRIKKNGRLNPRARAWFKKSALAKLEYGVLMAAQALIALRNASHKDNSLTEFNRFFAQSGSHT